MTMANDMVKFGFFIAVLIVIISICALIMFRKDDGSPFGFVLKMYKRIIDRFS